MNLPRPQRIAKTLHKGGRYTIQNSLQPKRRADEIIDVLIAYANGQLIEKLPDYEKELTDQEEIAYYGAF